MLLHFLLFYGLSRIVQSKDIDHEVSWLKHYLEIGKKIKVYVPAEYFKQLVVTDKVFLGEPDAFFRLKVNVHNETKLLTAYDNWFYRHDEYHSNDLILLRLKLDKNLYTDNRNKGHLCYPR